MILEELEASGCTFPKSVDDHAWVPRAMRGALGAKRIEQAREKFSAGFPPVFAELCRLYADPHERVCDLWDEGTQACADLESVEAFREAM
jgi:hypothetical protein